MITLKFALQVYSFDAKWVTEESFTVLAIVYSVLIIGKTNTPGKILWTMEGTNTPV